MEKSYFNTLTANVKADVTAQCGELIVTINTIDKIIALFAIEKFFVEIFIDKTSSKLEDIKVQDNDEILYEYVKDLYIDELTNHL